jgi:hypothetical protein
MPNLMGKTRPVENPYLTVEHPNAHGYGPTTFKVLKAYQIDPNKPYGRVFVSAVSAATGPRGDLGDAYWGDVIGEVTQRDPIVTDDMLPAHLLGGENTSTTLAGVMEAAVERGDLTEVEPGVYTRDGYR